MGCFTSSLSLKMNMGVEDEDGDEGKFFGRHQNLSKQNQENLSLNKFWVSSKNCFVFLCFFNLLSTKFLLIIWMHVEYALHTVNLITITPNHHHLHLSSHIDMEAPCGGKNQ